MLKKLTKTLCLFFAIIFAISSSALAVSASSYPENEASSLSSYEQEIESLFDQRAAVLAQIFGEQSPQLQSSRIDALNAIDMQLARKGVTFLSLDEVHAQFPETKSNKELSLSGQTMGELQEGAQAPRVEVPDSAVNSWASYRSTYTSGGVTYNIQKLIAQPTSSSSPLTDIGTRTITFSRNWQAGATNVLSTLAEAGVGLFVEEIPGASIVLTLYDAVKSFFTGISTTTEVDVPNIAYSWSNVTTASFMYVRQNNQTDDYQWLSLICTKTTTAVGYQLPKFDYKNSNGSWVLTPQVVQGSRTIYTTPSSYNSNSLAVSAYTSVSGGPLQNCVSYVEISGPESKRVEKIYPCYPAFPLHCEF